MSSLVNHNFKNENGLPEGGHVFGPGFAIAWQRGPLSEGQNGAFVEDILRAVEMRLGFFQSSELSHPKNAAAIDLIREAIRALDERTAERQARGVEGPYVK